jgi:hypothetical protein
MRLAATVRPVKYVLLLAIVLLAGCETAKHKKDVGKYTRLTITDPSGDLISEWIAEGHVKKTEQGYEIMAIERRTAPPYPITSQYPNGRRSTIVGPNIILEEIEKPRWLKKLDHEQY